MQKEPEERRSETQMAKKEFKYRGKSSEELKKLTLKEFAEIVPSRIRRTIKRGFKESHKVLLKKLRSKQKDIKTHCRDMIIIPEMIGRTILVYSGKEFKPVEINAEKVGHYLGEFVQSRNRVSHGSPGVGASRSSSNVSVK